MGFIKNLVTKRKFYKRFDYIKANQAAFNTLPMMIFRSKDELGSIVCRFEVYLRNDGSFHTFTTGSESNISAEERTLAFAIAKNRLTQVSQKIRQKIRQNLIDPEATRKEDLKLFLVFLKAEGIVIESENKPQDFDFLYDVWSGKNPDGLTF